MVTARLIVKGRVQGVFYRQSTLERARQLGLSGWVRNMPDGSVELEASGPKNELDKLIQWCHGGPPAASVTGVEVEWKDEDEDGRAVASGFHVR